MTNHFAGSCRSSVGSWTNAALQQTQSLIATLQSVKAQQNSDCAGLAQALQATQEMHTRLSAMVKDPVVSSYRVAEERKLEILLALKRMESQGGGNPEQVAALREELYAAEIELVKTKAEASVSRDEQERTRVINGLSDLHQYVLALLSQGNMTACLASAPQMPLGIAASLLTIGGNFTTPMVGSGLSAIGNLMATTVNYLRKLPIESAQLDLQNTQMQAALTCSLEAMSDLYCDADSSRQFIEFAAESVRRRDRPGEVWRGMDLLGRRVPILNRWLLKVSSGVDPSDKQAAQRLNEVWEKQSLLREIRNLVQGEVNRIKRLLEGVSDPNEIRLREKEGFKLVLGHIYPTMYGGRGPATNPVAAIFSKAQAMCRLIGVPTCDPSAIQEGMEDSYIDANDIVGGFSAFDARLKTMLGEVERLVNKELLNTINQDPEILVAEAIQPSLDNWSPLRVFTELSAFATQYANGLRKIPTSELPGRDRVIAVAEESARLFQEAADEIGGSNKAPEVINAVFLKLKLLDGIQFLNQRVTQLVRWELEARIRRGELPPDISDDLIAGGISVVEQLEQAGINIQSDADALMGDISGAQYTSMENLRQTSEVFGKTLGKLMGEIKKSSVAAGETSPSDPAARRLAQLCILTLTTSPSWPKDVDMHVCKHTKLVSVYKEGGLTLSFDDLRDKIVTGKLKSFKDRVCVYSNFLRAGRLFRARQPMEFPPVAGRRFHQGIQRALVPSPLPWEMFPKIPAQENQIDVFVTGR